MLRLIFSGSSLAINVSATDRYKMRMPSADGGREKGREKHPVCNPTCICRPQPAQSSGLRVTLLSLVDSGLLGGPKGSVLNDMPDVVSSLTSVQSVRLRLIENFAAESSNVARSAVS